jgi:Ran-binding protein 3
MATPPKRSPTPDKIALEDPDTAAARKELRQTAISEKPGSFAMTAVSDDAPSAADALDKDMTPELEPDDTARELISSPKKKRHHDDVDGPKDATATADADRDVSPIGSNGSASINRTTRSEPEKKRPRDVSSESKVDPTETTVRVITLPYNLLA